MPFSTLPSQKSKILKVFQGVANADISAPGSPAQYQIKSRILEYFLKGLNGIPMRFLPDSGEILMGF